jgi:hypothetical protein
MDTLRYRRIYDSADMNVKNWPSHYMNTFLTNYEKSMILVVTDNGIDYMCKNDFMYSSTDNYVIHCEPLENMHENGMFEFYCSSVMGSRNPMDFDEPSNCIHCDKVFNEDECVLEHMTSHHVITCTIEPLDNRCSYTLEKHSVLIDKIITKYVEGYTGIDHYSPYDLVSNIYDDRFKIESLCKRDICTHTTEHVSIIMQYVMSSFLQMVQRQEYGYECEICEKFIDADIHLHPLEQISDHMYKHMCGYCFGCGDYNACNAQSDPVIDINDIDDNNINGINGINGIINIDDIDDSSSDSSDTDIIDIIDGNYRYLCAGCDVTSYDYNEMISHILVEHGRDVIAMYAVSQDTDDVYYHEYVMDSDDTVVTDSDDEYFYDSDIDSDIDSDMHECPVCHETFGSNMLLNTHFIEAHDNYETMTSLDNIIGNYPGLDALTKIDMVRIVKDKTSCDDMCCICMEYYDRLHPGYYDDMAVHYTNKIDKIINTQLELINVQYENFYETTATIIKQLRYSNINMNRIKYMLFNDDTIFMAYDNVENMSNYSSNDRIIRYPLKLMCCKQNICSVCLSKNIEHTNALVCVFCKHDHCRDDMQYVVYDERSDRKIDLETVSLLVNDSDASLPSL